MERVQMCGGTSFGEMGFLNEGRPPKRGRILS